MSNTIGEQDLYLEEKLYDGGDKRDAVSISRSTLDINALLNSARSPRSVSCIQHKEKPC